jgi:DNA-binding beta-propeller fold protein YncE
MRAERTLMAVVCLLSGCARGATTRAPVGGAPAPIAAPSATTGTPSTAAPWAVAYERACIGSETAPFVDAKQTLIGFCDAVFSFDEGTRLGALPVGASDFAGEREVIGGSYSGLGVEISPVLGRRPEAVRSFGGGSGRSVALSPDGKRAIAVLDDREVVVLALPNLERLDGAPLEGGPLQTGFLADGTPVVLAEHGCVTQAVACEGEGTCSRTDCDGWALSRVARGALVDMGPQFATVQLMSFARNGSRAVVERDDRSRAVVALPSGDELVELPSGDDDRRFDDAPFALSDAGDRVAYFAEGQLVIAALGSGTTGGAAMTPLHSVPFASASSIAFSPDGRTVLVKTIYGMIAFREGAPERAAPESAYAVTPPAGFHEVFRRQTPVSVDRPLEDDLNEDSWSPSGAVTQFRGGDDIWVTVSMLDPRELGDANVPIAEWAEHAASTDGEGPNRVENVHTWNGPGGRALEYVRFVRTGCEPSDDYVRFTERDGAVYRVEIAAPPGTPRGVIAPLEHVFFDAPLGEPTAERAFATPAPVPPGPC